MRGNLQVLMAAIALAFLSQNAKSAALDQCFPDSKFLKTKIECTLANQDGSLSFSLTQGQTINVSGTGKYGTINKTFKVLKENIVSMPPRLSDVGAMDESVRFLGTSSLLSGSYIATIDIPCRQTAYGTVGFGKKSDDEDEVPSEHIAACRVK